MENPVVDVTVAVHTSTRPISRAVASVLEHTTTPVRVTVVAHNIDPEVIRANLAEWAAHPAVRLLHLADGIPSPAGPMNLGLAESTADFLAVMGSDDELERGAIDSWMALQRSSGAAVVITQIQNVGGSRVPSPPARPRRATGLDPVKDRLSYRSAPLGLFSRARFGQLRFAEGLASGEDLPFVTRLWFSGESIAFDRTGPAYLVHADAGDRVTTTARSIDADFAFLDRILDEPDIRALGRRHREALAIKFIRMHLFDAVVNRASAEWPTGEREALASVAHRLLAWSGRPERLLSRLDRLVLEGILDVITPVEEMMALIRRRWNYRSIDVVVPRNPFMVLHRQGPLRTYAGGYFV